MLQDDVTFVAKHLGMQLRDVVSQDFVTFRALFESCERDHARDILERAELDLDLAGAAAGSQEAMDAFQERLKMYRYVLGQDESERNDLAALQRDFGRGL